MGLFDKIFKKQSSPETKKPAPAAPAAKAAEQGVPFKQVTAKDVDVSDVICRIVGKKVSGIPAAEIKDGKMTHILIDATTKEVYRAVQMGAGWTVLLMEARGPEGVSGGGIHTIWTTDADPAAENAKKLIEAFLPEGTKLNLQYTCQARETKTDISRKTFNSSMGPIRLHTRRAKGGTEGAIEVCQLQTCVQFFHNAQTGAAETTGQCVTVPF